MLTQSTQIKDALKNWLSDLARRDHNPLDLYVTLAMHEASRSASLIHAARAPRRISRQRPITTIPPEMVLAMQRHLTDWDARLSRQLLGPSWMGKVDERPYWVFVLQGGETNPHWHGQVSLGSPAHRLIARTEAAGIWTKLVPNGTCDVRAIGKNKGDAERVAEYNIREIWDGNHLPMAISQGQQPTFW